MWREDTLSIFVDPSGMIRISLTVRGEALPKYPPFYTHAICTADCRSPSWGRMPHVAVLSWASQRFVACWQVFHQLDVIL